MERKPKRREKLSARIDLTNEDEVGTSILNETLPEVRKLIFGFLFDNDYRKTKVPLLLKEEKNGAVFDRKLKTDFDLGWKMSYIGAVTRSANKSWEGEFERLAHNGKSWKLIRSICSRWRREVDEIFHFEDYTWKGVQHWYWSIHQESTTVLGYAVANQLHDLAQNIMNNRYTTEQSFHMPMTGRSDPFIIPILVKARAKDTKMIDLLLNDQRMNVRVGGNSIFRNCTKTIERAVYDKYPELQNPLPVFYIPWIETKHQELAELLREEMKDVK